MSRKMSNEYDDVVAYLSKGIYPDTLSKNEKRALRQKSQSFVLKEQVLYHLGSKRKEALVITDDKRKQEIMTELHSG